ncbi:putative UDP-Gal or UDP-GlcNAc-dependent glycosyltransferase [Trypanosoma theileri]|uniref:Hexosyltransferase n=1 Tax=Trypanosoma theileri TaxID=67003 RepID=A0A1X0NDD5_9TRYP|nr:putative UDP-Gal or UDP-GlcNAc-dependent glycosyltransferase [Trypanosoma theileri]ORC79393.1 putative UDP-Gal or UDP-GlcNAc-dependent glycosyltransferase [Trypanosoma theileri]
MSKKTFFWFELALRLFPNTSYIAKGDDDMFLRVPQYLADLRTLPRRGLYWGSMYKYRVRSLVDNTMVKFFFSSGPCNTLARDVVERIVSFEPLRRLIHTPYSKERESEFLALCMEHEDTMVGRVVHELHYSELIMVREKKCRFHNLRKGCRIAAPSNSSVMIHHIVESEYIDLMKRYEHDTAPKAKFIKHRHDYLYFAC